MSKIIYFTSKRNYMKRDPSSGSTNMAAPVTPAYTLQGLFVTNFTVTHNLGFVPLFRLGYEPFADGVIWPPMGSRLGGGAINPRNTAATGPGLIAWPTTTTLKIQLFYNANTLTGTFPVTYTIYKDFAL